MRCHMGENTRIHFIPAKPPKRDKRVAIYARVSTNDTEQLKSLAAQVSAFTRLVSSTPQWLLVDVYMDTASGKAGAARKEFSRMLVDCKAHNIEIILTKSLSRFGRDTVEVLEALRQLREFGVRVIFEDDNMDTENTDHDLMISLVESVAQSENESRSDNIKWGIRQRAANGSSKLYDRKCYGYAHDTDGNLVLDPEEAKNVRIIFNLYLHGKSIIGIVKELEQHGIKSPTGKDNWCKRSVEVVLNNEKYTGTVRLLDSGKHELQYVSENNNPAIISKETFRAVQIEKARRSNVTQVENGNQRKNKKYSSKK